MEFNMEMKIVEEEVLNNEEVIELVDRFLQDNDDLEGICRIQIDEIMSFLKGGIQMDDENSSNGNNSNENIENNDSDENIENNNSNENIENNSNENDDNASYEADKSE